MNIHSIEKYLIILQTIQHNQIDLFYYHIQRFRLERHKNDQNRLFSNWNFFSKNRRSYSNGPYNFLTNRFSFKKFLIWIWQSFSYTTRSLNSWLVTSLYIYFFVYYFLKVFLTLERVDIYQFVTTVLYEWIIIFTFCTTVRVVWFVNIKKNHLLKI